MLNKKLLSLALAATMGLSLVGYGSHAQAGSSGDNVKLTMACWGSELDAKTYRERADHANGQSR